MKELLWILGAVCAIVIVVWRFIVGKAEVDQQRVEQLLVKLRSEARKRGFDTQTVVEQAIQERKEEIAHELEGRSPADVIADVLRDVPPSDGAGGIRTT